MCVRIMYDDDDDDDDDDVDVQDDDVEGDVRRVMLGG